MSTFKMPCLPLYKFDINGDCFTDNGTQIRRFSTGYYKLIDETGEYCIITTQEIIQYGKHIFPDMRTVTMSIVYPVRASKANNNL